MIKLQNKLRLYVLTAICFGFWSFGPGGESSIPALAAAVHYSVVTTEIKSAPKGKPEIEVYRFDPGVLVVQEGDAVQITFYGVKGSVHPIEIPGYSIQTVIKRGEQQTVQFLADHPGYFKIICTAHPTVDKHGPMEATLIVLPKSKYGE